MLLWLCNVQGHLKGRPPPLRGRSVLPPNAALRRSYTLTHMPISCLHWPFLSQTEQSVAAFRSNGSRLRFPQWIVGACVGPPGHWATAPSGLLAESSEAVRQLANLAFPCWPARATWCARFGASFIAGCSIPLDRRQRNHQHIARVRMVAEQWRHRRPLAATGPLVH